MGAASFAAFKTSLSLNAVENTALSTWPGSANITTLGTIVTGVWNGTTIAAANGGTGLTALSANVVTLLGAANYASFKTSLSLNNVENTALSTWAGSSSITTLGTVVAPIFSGIVTLSGASVKTVNAMGALAIDVTKVVNTKTISIDSTFTFSGTPATAQTWFALLVTNSDTNPHTLTIPSSFSIAANTSITTVTIPASGKLLLTWQYDGSAYNLYGDPPATTGNGSFALSTGAALTDSTLSVSAPSTNSVGYLGIPQNSKSAAYTTIMADAGKHILHPSADTTARTFTIDSNANVAYPIGTALTFINQNAGGVITIAITSDTMRLAGAGTTGSRSLAANGIATAVKVTSTEWIISGTGLT